MAQFGQYMFQSHESSRDFLKNSTKELDILVDLARKHPGVSRRAFDRRRLRRRDHQHDHASRSGKFHRAHDRRL
jgi:uncharacterized protein (DUF2384 family)